MYFAENLEMTNVVGGGGRQHVVGVIMAHCVQNSICDSALISYDF